MIQSFIEKFLSVARQYPQSIAVSDERRRVTYRELDERSNAIARMLRGHYVEGRENLVALLLPRDSCFPVAATGMEAEEKERIGRYIGDIAWNHGVLSVPETILGRATYDNSATFTLDKEHCFYEFIDETDETANPILLRDIQIGRTYRLIITNDSGLYRLYTDYKIRFVENTVSSAIFVPVHIRN